MRLTTDDGVELHYEVTGDGPDLLFLHEFSGDHRSWRRQIEFFARRYRCIVFAARGFPPSAVPERVEEYSQHRAVADALAVLDQVRSTRAHLVGVSMGGFTALNLALDRPDRVASAVITSVGYGADADPQVFRAEMEAMATLIRDEGCARLAEMTAQSPYRLALRTKDPLAFAEWQAMLAEHDATGMANTLLGVQRDRPTLLELAGRIGSVGFSGTPLLFVAGDEDDPVLEANLAAKRACPTAGLSVLPKTAHTVNLEEPQLFNRTVLDFLTWVDAGTWPRRDPRSQPGSGGWIR